ncbi:MAG: membrane protein insertase YidC, partial [Bacteroidota bacterium]
MDRNQFIGLILMFALLAVYFTWFAPEPPTEELTTQETMPSEVVSEQPSQDTTSTTTISSNISDTLQNAINQQKYGAFAFAASTEEREKIVENEELKIVFSNKGGKIKQVILKKHNDYMGNPLVIMDQAKSTIDLIVDHSGRKINLNDLSFTSQVASFNDTTQLSYTLKGSSFSISQNYLIPPTGFQIAYNTQGAGLNNVLSPSDISFKWNHSVNRAESNLDDARIKSNVRYYLANEDFDELSESSTDYEEETLGTQIRWASFKQKFFTSAIIANESFKSGYVNQKVDFADTSTVKTMSMQMLIPYADFVNGFSARYYFGTNNYAVLKKVAPEFEENLDMGWGPLPIVNKYVIIPIFHLLEGFLSNYGIIILIIVVVIRLILSPLTWKSHMSMAKMRVMKPELDEIKAKHDGDMQKAQQEQMKLYQQVGINPLSGCIPMLLQMPILFALFFFFPNAVELRQQSFLWAHDLSTFDSIINLPFEIPF